MTEKVAKEVRDILIGKHYMADWELLETINLEEFWKIYDEDHTDEKKKAIIEMIVENRKDVNGFFANFDGSKLFVYFPQKYDLYYHSVEMANKKMSVTETSEDFDISTGPEHEYYVLEWLGEDMGKMEEPDYECENFETEEEYEKYVAEHAEEIWEKFGDEIKVRRVQAALGEYKVFYSVKGKEYGVDLTELVRQYH